MGRNLSLLARQLAFEEDGVTHRRDCACARCDAGYGPTEQERAEAARRWEERRAQAAAVRALARKREGERLKRAETDLFIHDQVRAANDHLRDLHDLEARIRRDRRLDELWRLRRQGLSLRESMAEIDRRFPAAAADGAGDDDAAADIDAAIDAAAVDPQASE
jgi:hypothetical protein